jgi:hypothetical protein
VVGGHPPAATIIEGTVVINRSSMIRGLVSATYAPIRSMKREGAFDSTVIGGCSSASST